MRTGRQSTVDVEGKLAVLVVETAHVGRESLTGRVEKVCCRAERTAPAETLADAQGA